MLEETVMVRDDETKAYNRAQFLNNCLTSIFLAALVLETALFYLYTNMVTLTNNQTRSRQGQAQEFVIWTEVYSLGLGTFL